MVKLVPKYASFAAPPCLSVVSYNLLAPLYVRPIDKRTGGIQAFAAFQWAEPADDLGQGRCLSGRSTDPPPS